MTINCYLCTKHNTAGAEACPGPGPDCTTVKNFTCGYCKGKGHTIKHCSVLAANKTRRRAQEGTSRGPTTDEDGFTTVAVRKHAPTAALPKDAPVAHLNRFTTLKRVNLTATVPAPASAPKLQGAWAARAAQSQVADTAPTKPDMSFGTLYSGAWGDDE